MGPSLRMVMVSKLTVALGRFTKVHMFGPGTTCRCANCTRVPRSCEWGHGIYAGTIQLYALEMAMNALWTQREYEANM